MHTKFPSPPDKTGLAALFGSLLMLSRHKDYRNQDKVRAVSRENQQTSLRAKAGFERRMHLISFALAGAFSYGISGMDPMSASAGVQVAESRVTIAGRATVIDGDTIEIHGERIRLNGIDAPEKSQTCADDKGKPYRCGSRAASELDRFLRRFSPTRCEFVERDRYGRFVGECFRADGASVQAALVRSGWAMDWPRYSGGAYASQQAAAKREKLGMWAGSFQPPWEWRAEEWQAQQQTQAAPLMKSGGATGDCRVKGNISAKGDRIYHVPGQEHYTRTNISENKGERWFCSEEEARAAGWRPARR